MTPFSNVLGQEAIKGYLSSILSQGQISNAYLFFGPSGVGRFTTAKTFASGVLTGCCCGMCPQCLKVLKEDHPDLMIVSSEKGRNGPIKIDQIRELKAFMSWRPALSDKKVCIIVDAEGMTDNASQSLLRVLEEPKEGTIILVTSSKNLLETVVSRCQIVSFGVLPRETVELFLKQKFPQADRELLSIALDLCHGSITDAEKFIKPELASLIRQLTSILSYTTKDWSVDLQMFFSSSDVFLAFYALKILLLRTINLKLGIKIPATGLASEESLITTKLYKLSFEELLDLLAISTDIIVSVTKNANVKLSLDYLSIEISRRLGS